MKVYCRYCRRYTRLSFLYVCKCRWRDRILEPAKEPNTVTGYGGHPERFLSGYEYPETVKRGEAEWSCIPDITLWGRWRQKRGLPIGPDEVSEKRAANGS